MKIKKLFFFKKRKFGRSNGKISVNHIGQGHKKKYKIIDFIKNKFEIPAVVSKIEYDSYRNSNVILLKYLDGDYKYVLQIENLKLNDKIIYTLKKKKLNIGDSTFIKNIKIGSFINCIEKFPNSGSVYSRSSGTYSELIYKDNKYAIIKLSSNIKKKINLNCKATLGKIFNKIKNKMYKAGQNRWKGIKPTVRGVAMNPVDHPLGGGEGKTSGGRHPCSSTGIKSKGLKTKKCQDH
ncbi:MAG: 50S ribosomal protein L2 [Candidatus Carsonella ruddii]